MPHREGFVKQKSSFGNLTTALVFLEFFDLQPNYLSGDTDNVIIIKTRFVQLLIKRFT